MLTAKGTNKDIVLGYKKEASFRLLFSTSSNKLLCFKETHLKSRLTVFRKQAVNDTLYIL